MSTARVYNTDEFGTDEFGLVAPEKPKVPNLGPGPLKAWQFSPAKEAEYKKQVTQSGSHGFTSREDTDGVLHRNQGNRKLGTTGVAGLFRETVALIKEVTGASKESKVVFIEGGHDAANTAHANFFATEKEVPVVAICNGGFSNLWGKDLKEQYEQKGHLNKVILIELQDGESPTAEQVQKALEANGVQNGAPFNITFTSNETSTGVAIPEDEMVKILNIPGRKRAIIDASSGLMIQKIPGLTGDNKQDGVTRGVTVFATAQKAMRGPTDYTALIISPDDLDVVNEKIWTKSTVPMPKEVRIEPTELNMQAPKRSSRVEGARELHYALSVMLDMQKNGHDHIKHAALTSSFVKAAVKKRTDFKFFVQDLNIRSNYNMVVVSTNPQLAKLTAEQRSAVMQEAHELLSDEDRAIDVKPYGPRGDFRFTTLDIESEQQAKITLDNFAYTIDKAILKMQAKTIDLIAEDQFLYANSKDVEEAIEIKTKELDAKGITFIDARPGKLAPRFRDSRSDDPDAIEYGLLASGKYLIYKPQLLDDTITQEYKKIRSATLNKTAIIAAAKNVPAEAKFNIFVREGAGTNNMPKAQAEKDGHVVINCPGENSKVTSNNTLNALAGHQHIHNFIEAAMQGKASALNLQPLYGTSPQVDLKALNNKVEGKTVAVLGAGDIGTQTILELLKSDVKEIRVYSRSLVGKYGTHIMSQLSRQIPNLKKLVICDSIDDALRGSNIAINHMALVPETQNIIGKTQIDLMANAAEIIDAARPGIINPDALITAHQSGKLSRVVVDFDTPDKAPKDEAIGKLFSYAKAEYSKNPQGNSFLYVPHAFADTCPVTRSNMLENAMQRADEVRQGKIHNFAGTGDIPKDIKENLGAQKPTGIVTLGQYLGGVFEEYKNAPRARL